MADKTAAEMLADLEATLAYPPPWLMPCDSIAIALLRDGIEFYGRVVETGDLDLAADLLHNIDHMRDQLGFSPFGRARLLRQLRLDEGIPPPERSPRSRL